LRRYEESVVSEYNKSARSGEKKTYRVIPSTKEKMKERKRHAKRNTLLSHKKNEKRTLNIAYLCEEDALLLADLTATNGDEAVVTTGVAVANIFFFLFFLVCFLCVFLLLS